MNNNTRQVLEKLEGAGWFSAVGQQNTKMAIILTSWEEAVTNCTSEYWDDFLLEMANRYREQLLLRSKTHFARWNEVVNDLKKYTEPLVTSKMAQAVRDRGVPAIIEGTVRWDILHLAAESEFVDICPPGFYTSLLPWYTQGHFLCGWQGNFPDGKPVIY